MMSKFQDRTILVGGDTWPSCSSERRRRRLGKKNKEIKFARAKSKSRSYGFNIKNNKKIKKYRVQGSCFRSNISETVRDIRVSFLLWPTESHATKRYNPRLCCCYRFWDIVVANINNFKIFDFDVKFARATWYMPSNEFARHNFRA